RAPGETLMELGFVGLGRMGLNMVTRLTRGGHTVLAFDRSAEAVGRSRDAGAGGVTSLEALVGALKPPRAVWGMVPAGGPAQSPIEALARPLSAGHRRRGGGHRHFPRHLRA